MPEYLAGVLMHARHSMRLALAAMKVLAAFKSHITNSPLLHAMSKTLNRPKSVRNMRSLPARAYNNCVLKSNILQIAS